MNTKRASSVGGAEAVCPIRGFSGNARGRHYTQPTYAWEATDGCESDPDLRPH